MSIKVLLADDHTLLVRQGLKSLLGTRGHPSRRRSSRRARGDESGRKALSDVAVIDIGMPLLNGLDAARELKRSAPKTKTEQVNCRDEDEYLIEALRAGVKGYVLKNQAASDLVHAIQLVCRGQVYLSPGMSSVVVDAYLSKAEPRVDPISSREREVLQLIAEGKSTKDIASAVGY